MRPNSPHTSTVTSLSNTGGTFGNSGTVDVATISGGAVTNTGDLATLATLTGGTLDTSGTATEIVNNGGDVDVTGGSVGILTNTLGTADILAGATVTDLANAASATNAGTVTTASNSAGTLDNSGSIVTLDVTGGGVSSTGALTGVTTISGGTLDTSGTAADITNTGGAVTVSGGTVTSLTNTAGSADILAAGSVGTLTNADTASNAGSITNATNTAGTLSNSGTIATLDVTGGTVTSSGTLSGTATVTGGLLDTSGSANGIVNNGGAVDVTGGTVASIDNASGTLDIVAGTVTTVTNAATASNAGSVGDLTNTSGTFANNGSLGTVAITGGDVGNTGTITGTTTLTGGSLTTSGSAGAIDNAGGDVSVTAGTTGDISNAALLTITGGTTGALTNSGTASNAGTIGGDVTNTGGLSSTGTILGALANSGSATLDLSGVLDGPLTNADTAAVTISGDLTGVDSILQTSGGAFVLSGGTTTVDAGGLVQNDTTVTIQNPATLAGATTFTNGAGATVTVEAGGTLAMDLDNAAAATADLDGTVVGDVTNLGTLTLAGDITGTLTNDTGGSATIDGPSTVTGAVSNLGSFLVSDSLTYGGMTNNAGGPYLGDGSEDIAAPMLQVLSGGSLNGGTLTNNTGMAINDGGAVTGDLVNNGVLVAQGATQAGGTLTNAPGAVIDLQDGTVGAQMTIAGDAVLDGQMFVDVDLSAANSGFDGLVVGGDVSGALDLSFNNVGGPVLGQISNGYDIISYGGNSTLTATPVGLPQGGAILYSLADTGGALQLQSGANPSIGGLASGLALTQSLIGSVVNRPSSPFVTGLAAAEDEPCGVGAWGRGTGGRADAEGSTTTSLGSFGSSLSATYAGLQAGFDYSCFGGYYNGWDLSFGGMLGGNFGSTEQPVYRFDPVNIQLTNTVTSINTTDFTQVYGGVYLGAARDRLFADIQLRFDKTQFDLVNSPTALAGPNDDLGVSDQSYDSTGTTLSGSLGYAFPIDRERGLTLVPSVGFSFSKVSTDNIYFENDPGDPNDDGVLEIDDIDSRIGFASLTLSRSQILPSGTEALNYFGTATLYKDFASGVTSRYYERIDTATGNGDRSVTPLESTSSNLGAYGEISFGVNYTKLLDTGRAIPARQLDASVRVDGRFSNQLDGWGITAQVRLQF